ncbi:unnamed protein product [Prorocentrum cordatum]|uniref:Replication factor Mcm10 C-terminal domain-containing protein n=1 Tax=Prorocentrum cordatum TaxID=2364126 RepID=A0ABN9VBL2_9DINO|nr:unnamed protein product [Polarella glacialis]
MGGEENRAPRRAAPDEAAAPAAAAPAPQAGAAGAPREPAAGPAASGAAAGAFTEARDRDSFMEWAKSMAAPGAGAAVGGPASGGSASAALVRQIRAQFPDGIPAPDPNATPRTRPKQLARVHVPLEVGLPRQVFPVKPGGSRKQPVRRDSPSRLRQSSLSKLEAEFGKRVALQLTNGDPRKDPVRKQTSRFQHVVDQERAAKRDRQLAELEVQDEAQAKMEAIMHISVQAWKCQSCFTLTDSERARAECAKAGHVLEAVTAKKERWQCKGCSQDVSVLNRDLPAHCARCNGSSFQQVPLSRVRRAPMERDLLLPRGEELKFLNSLPGAAAQRSWQRPREAQDDYSTLDNPLGA